jgi:hypothetical protein
MKLLFLMAIAAGLSAQGPFAFRELNPAWLELTENGKPVFVYNQGRVLKEGVDEKWRRCCYIHPLYAPDGTAVTDDFPQDHLHHRGVFWTWPVVKIDGATYDLWTVQGIHDRFVRWIARGTSPDAARLAVENGWYVGDKKVLKETVEVVAHRVVSGSRSLDLTLTFEALEKPVEVSGAPEEKKGYGGLGVRFAPRENTVIRTDKGVEKKDTDRIPHPWAALDASFQGHSATLRIDPDPANPGFPNGWCLRNYGFLGVSFPGLETYVFRPGRPVLMKYRVTVSSGNRPR